MVPRHQKPGAVQGFESQFTISEVERGPCQRQLERDISGRP